MSALEVEKISFVNSQGDWNYYCNSSYYIRLNDEAGAASVTLSSSPYHIERIGSCVMSLGHLDQTATLQLTFLKYPNIHQ